MAPPSPARPYRLEEVAPRDRRGRPSLDPAPRSGVKGRPPGGRPTVFPHPANATSWALPDRAVPKSLPRPLGWNVALVTVRTEFALMDQAPFHSDRNLHSSFLRQVRSPGRALQTHLHVTSTVSPWAAVLFGCSAERCPAHVHRVICAPSPIGRPASSAAAAVTSVVISVAGGCRSPYDSMQIT